MRFALLFVALVACSSDPAPAVDAGAGDTGSLFCTPNARTPCTCAGGGQGEAICGPSGTEVSACLCAGVDGGPGDVGVVPDQLVPVDVVAVVDGPAADVVDAVVVDAGSDAVAVVDVGGDAGVPRDAGTDAGGVRYDLDEVRTAESYRVVFRQVDRAGATENCDRPATATSCSVSGGTLRFSLRSCGAAFTGLFSLANSADRSLSVSVSGAGNFAPTLRLTVGMQGGATPFRRSFHIQFARPVAGSEPGSEGIPGTTVDPTLGDLWVLGCPVVN